MEYLTIAGPQRGNEPGYLLQDQSYKSLGGPPGRKSYHDSNATRGRAEKNQESRRASDGDLIDAGGS